MEDQNVQQPTTKLSWVRVALFALIAIVGSVFVIRSLYVMYKNRQNVSATVATPSTPPASTAPVSSDSPTDKTPAKRKENPPSQKPVAGIVAPPNLEPHQPPSVEAPTDAGVLAGIGQAPPPPAPALQKTLVTSADPSNPLGLIEETMKDEGDLHYGMRKCQHEGIQWITCEGFVWNTGERPKKFTLEEGGSTLDNEGNSQRIYFLTGIRFGGSGTEELQPNTPAKFLLRFQDKSRGTSSTTTITLHADWGGANGDHKPMVVPVS